jgi:hypothetical protein
MAVDLSDLLLIQSNGPDEHTLGVKVSTYSRTIRATVKDLANKVFLALSSRVKYLYICFILIGLSKDERYTILKHRYKIPTIDT